MAALLGLIAVFLAQSYISNARRTPAQIGPTGPLAYVVVADQPIERGATIEPNMLKLVNFPAAAVPAGAFHSIDQLVGDKTQTRLALHSMVENEPILPANVSGPGGKLNLSTVVTPGMRAVSIRSNDVAGVGGFVLPGDRVDALLTRSTGTGNQASNYVTQIIAENIRVLGVDQTSNDEAANPVVAKAVTIEVTPEQAEAISLGQSVGTVSLSLRHVADDAPLKQKVMTAADLEPPAARRNTRNAARGESVRVIRGVEASRFNLATGAALQRMSKEAPAGVNTP